MNNKAVPAQLHGGADAALLFFCDMPNLTLAQAKASILS
jgi:hypothetical protein